MSDDTASDPISDTAQGQADVAPAPPDLSAPELYLNRELTWLSFNRRVLQLAADPRTPLLERVRFLAIVSGNIDGFFMKRIGGLKQLIVAGISTRSVDGRTPAQQIHECHTVVRQIQQERGTVFDNILEELRAEGIKLVTWQELDEADHQALRERYIQEIFPLVTPLAMDPGHPFPFISNLALNLLVTMRFPGEADVRTARVKVPGLPGIAPRLLALGSGATFISLDDVIANNLDLLFPGMRIESCELFRVTRNANVEMDQEQADDLLELMQTELKERHFAPIVRLQVAESMPAAQSAMLAAELGLDDEDVFTVGGLMAMNDLSVIADLPHAHLHYPPHQPADHSRLALDNRSIFHIIRDTGSLLLQHPYESFATSVERFLRSARSDPKVLAIKMTLYRTSADGRIINDLIEAARAGKQVAVLVELKARFDEAANIRWARRLEREGIHVTYGVMGLKTHCKIILVVRKDYDGLRRYAHIGTGNYHSQTARLYSDLGLLTCDDDITADLTGLTNYITGYSPAPRYRKLLVAPHNLKAALLNKIQREIGHANAGRRAHLQFKTNALEDSDITKALYEASMAGVSVDLLVRDTCRLRPGLPDVSPTVTVISTLGRFLEHARLYYFRNDGAEEYFLGSADLMHRNLEARVEVLTPVESKSLRRDLRTFLDIQLSDQRSAWDMGADGSYTLRQPSPELAHEGAQEEAQEGAQETLIALSEKHLAGASHGNDRQVRRKLYKEYRKRYKSNRDI
ncbi:MAG: polyphosphate kinase 1 [Pseudomonadota bacterium]